VIPVVLVADDDPFQLKLLQELCEAAGYRVLVAADGSETLDVVARQRPDLLLLDLALPVHDGFEVIRILKADAELAPIPIVVVTARGDSEARSRAIDLGADDYVSKPFRVFEVQQRIRAALRVRAAEAEAATARQRAQSAEVVDPLTQAGTSHQLLITLDYELTRASRYAHPLTVMIARIANYDALVSAGGADVGEARIVQLALGVRACVRSIDHLFRSDVEEFTIVLPETSPAGAQVVHDRIRERSESRTLWASAVQPLPALVLGVASLPEDVSDDARQLYRAALERLAPL
jgi:diguanylate cyclase (GGDEF)-like protein